MYGMFTYIYHKNQPSMYIGVYTIPMDPMGYNDLCLRNDFASLDVNFYELKTYQAYICRAWIGCRGFAMNVPFRGLKQGAYSLNLWLLMFEGDIHQTHSYTEEI